MNPETMTKIEELMAQLRSRLTALNRPKLEPKLKRLGALYLTAEQGGELPEPAAVDEVLASITDVASTYYHANASLAAKVQNAVLETPADELLLGAALAVGAAEYGGVVRASTATVLATRAADGDLGDLAHYAEQILDIAQNTGLKDGFDDAGILGGAQNKMFVRAVARATERLHHAALEGTVIPANDLWDFDGVYAPSPGHFSLPFSERIYCGHVCLYF